MASNSILKLQVDDKQYEASLKSAQQGLQALMNALRNSGKSFSDLDKNTEQYVRALGNMEATAKTTRGRIGEMSSAFVELSQVEKQLTDQERQSPPGKALTESLNQLKQRTIEAKQELADLDKQLTSQKAPATTDGIFSGIGSKMEGALTVFGGNLMTKAAGAVAQLGSEMYGMVQQGIELAKQGEGIRIAFERLGRGDILNGLREATHGTVTDLELMKAAVKFNDFKLPVEELGTMLAFAQQKAKDTGQSVDYMVDSIVTGLGRKSLMILDNLGLSATEIRERMKETGDMTKAVGAIIRDQMAKAGDYVETAADRAAQANVSLQNKMEELGRKFAPVEEASNQLWISMKIGILDIVGGPLARLLNDLTEAGRMKNALNDIGGNEQVDKQLGKLRVAQAAGSGYMTRSLYREQVKQYNRQINTANDLIKKYDSDHSSVNTVLMSASRQFGQKFDSISELKAFRDAYVSMKSEYMQGAKDFMKPVNVNTKQAEQNVASLRRQLKELEAQRKKAVKAGDQEQVENLTKQISQVKTNIGYLDPSATKGAKAVQDDFTEIIGLIGNAQEHVSDLQRQISESWDEGEIARLTDDLKAAEKELQRLKDIGKDVDLDKLFPDQTIPGASKSWAGSMRESLISDLGNSMMEADKSAIQNIIKEGFTNGVDLTEAGNELLAQLFEGMDVPDDKIKELLEKVNEKIRENGGIELTVDTNTGDVSKKGKKSDSDGLGNAKKVTAGLNQVASGLQQMGIQLPEGVNQVLGVVNGLMSILQGINIVIGVTQFAAITANTISLDLLTAAVWANTASSFIPFAGGGIVGFAKGGLIGKAASGMLIGNSYSGDNLRLPVNGGGYIGVNDGELILNRAQQGVLADTLQGGGAGNLELSVKVTAEELRFILGNNSRRRGKGEYVTTNRLR